MKRQLLYPTVAALVALTAMSAFASWSKPANGSGAGKAKSAASMASIVPTVNVGTPGQATVTWTAPTGNATNTSITGYRVVRWDAGAGGNATNVCAANLTSTALTCTDSPAPAGAFWYTVAAVYTNAGSTAPTWTGVSSVRAAAVSTPTLRSADDSGNSNSDRITNVTSPHFIGTATVGATVQIFDGTHQIASDTATGGNYDIQVPVATPLSGDNGTDTTGVVHTISATATVDSATVNSGTTTVTVDSTGAKVSSVTSANCTPVSASCVAGRADNGDKVLVTFGEKVVEGLTSSQTMAVCNRNNCTPNIANGSSKITIPGLTSSSGVVIQTAYAPNNSGGTANGTLSVSTDQLTITYTLTSNLSNNPATGTSQTFTFAPDNLNITDRAGNVATSTKSVTLQLF